jgi:predicted flap endonuclease-1-like 5' DNA nuclease
MLYLVSQTALFILIAGAIGLWLGWYLGKLSRDQEMNHLENLLRSRQRELAAVEERSAAVSRQLAEGSAALADCEGARKALNAEVADLREALNTVQPQPLAAEQPPAPPAIAGLPPADGTPDDLQKIKGIGPRLASLLNELGIYKYRQIAAFTPDDVARVNDRLRFKGRIEREQWVEQAKALSD